jgi:hypothetical protein
VKLTYGNEIREKMIFFLFFERAFFSLHANKDKKIAPPLCFSFFVSESQLQPDQPGLQRARNNRHFSTISVRHTAI